MSGFTGAVHHRQGLLFCSGINRGNPPAIPSGGAPFRHLPPSRPFPGGRRGHSSASHRGCCRPERPGRPSGAVIHHTAGCGAARGHGGRAVPPAGRWHTGDRQVRTEQNSWGGHLLSPASMAVWGGCILCPRRPKCGILWQDRNRKEPSLWISN